MPTTLLDRLLILQASHCFFCDKRLSREEASVEHLVPLVAWRRPGAQHGRLLQDAQRHFGSIELKAKLLTILKKREVRLPGGLAELQGPAPWQLLCPEFRE